MFNDNGEIVAECILDWDVNKEQIESMLRHLTYVCRFGRDAYLHVRTRGYPGITRFPINDDFVALFREFKSQMYDETMPLEDLSPLARYAIEFLKRWEYMVITFVDK